MTTRELNRSNETFRLARATYVVTIERGGEQLCRRLACGALACRSQIVRACRDAGATQAVLATAGLAPLEQLGSTEVAVESPWTPPGGYVVTARVW